MENIPKQKHPPFGSLSFAVASRTACINDSNLFTSLLFGGPDDGRFFLFFEELLTYLGVMRSEGRDPFG